MELAVRGVQGTKRILETQEERIRNPDRRQRFVFVRPALSDNASEREAAFAHEAADAVEKDDEEFARYLRNRARDLMSDDYESGDAAWIEAKRAAEEAMQNKSSAEEVAKAEAETLALMGAHDPLGRQVTLTNDGARNAFTLAD